MKRLFAIVVVCCGLAPGGSGPRFYEDDPIWKMPRPLPVKDPNKRKIDQLYDFALNSIAPPGERQLPGRLIPAEDVNTLGEVPDSTWYTNRHYRTPMTLDQLRRGAGTSNQPVPPFQIVGAKTEGVTPGFQMRDARGRRYLCKPDPASNPEMATAADVVSSKFFYAFGYNVPENYIVYFDSEQLTVDPKATVEGLNGKDRPMNDHDRHHLLARMPRDGQGRYRVMASLFIAGEGIGPFRWYGVRRDDPDDLFPHENRRSLRGAYVFAAWLNHTDAKANNTYDAVQQIDGVPAIVHYFIDFGASLGSDSDEPKNARFGHEYMVVKEKRVLWRMIGLGLYSPEWERADFPGIPAVGNFEAETFEPDEWTPNYPVSAFLNRLPDDTFWAAKQVMAFTPEQIRAIVETGQYTDERAVDYIAGTLIQRQQKIGRYYFSRVLPLDRFEVRNGELRFEDLSARHGFSPARTYRVHWQAFDNSSAKLGASLGDASFRVPRRDGYVAAEISGEKAGQLVRVYVRGTKVVGIERTW